jgi:DNA-binding response OmpR family regulator
VNQSIRTPDAPPPIILLVEDDADTRELYRTAFDLEGFWMAEARSADEAFEYAQDVMPDAILTDVGLAGAGGSGIDFVRRLKTVPKMSRIPVLAVTGRDPRALGDVGELFNDVLVKPVLPDILVGRVRSVLEHSVSLRLRSERARAKTPDLVAKSAALMTKSRRLTSAGAAGGPRPCPRCGCDLQWSERRVTLGVLFDYYKPCRRGCGLFCYDHGGGNFVPLIE